MLAESPFLVSAAKISEPPVVVFVGLTELVEWSSMRWSDKDDDDDGADMPSDEDPRG